MKSLSKTSDKNRKLLHFPLERFLRRFRSALVTVWVFGWALILVTAASGCSLYRSQARKALENDGINCARGLACSAAATGLGAQDCRALSASDIESFSPNDAHVVFDNASQSYFICR